MTESTSISTATRRSIQKNFPLGRVMSSGENNPITLHSVNDELFAGMWSVIAETMVVDGELPRATKESIACLVSQRNECPVCVVAHTMMGTVANSVQRSGTGFSSTDQPILHCEALNYAELLIYQVHAQRSDCVDLSNTAAQYSPPTSISLDTTDCFRVLTEAAMAEVSLVVALFLHMNRVVSAIMGEQMSTAMMRVPRQAAKVMERVGVVKRVSKVLSPMLAKTFQSTPESGFTRAIFEPNSNYQHHNTSNNKTVHLPQGLQSLMLAGTERAKAVSRLIHWVARYESDLLLDGTIFDYDLIRFIDLTTRTTKDDLGSSEEALQWIEETVRRELDYSSNNHHNSNSMDDSEEDTCSDACIREEWHLALATVLILITLAPKAIYRSQPWETLVARLGEAQARSVVIFWSLRTTLQEAHILFSGVQRGES